MAKGNKTGGRPRGSKNKSTIEREINAAAEIDRARREGRELAKDVLERLMKVAEGATGLNRPTTEAELARGMARNPDGDWGRFGDWFDRTVYCAKELAKYQSPTYRAIAFAGDAKEIGFIRFVLENAPLIEDRGLLIDDNAKGAKNAA